jgi:uncharacterized membrane protein YjgN (DUF898 family)
MDGQNQEQAASAAGRTYPVEFRGTAREYFGIWIVNILLTILTIGIYSAWAKVRRERYFRGSTLIDGHAFDYHARPIAILIGRIIVVGLLIAYVIAANLNPFVPIVLIPFFIFVLPWLIMRGLRFNCRVTSYRNVRFDFVGTYFGAMKAFVLGTVVAIFTLGLAAPVASRWSAAYIVNNLRYGGRPFVGEYRVGPFYRALMLPFLIAIAGLLVAAGLAVLLIFANAEEVAASVESDDPRDQIALLAIVYVLFLAFAIGFAIASLLYRAAVRNIVFNSAVLDGRHALQSAVGRWRLVWISVSNTFLTIITIGLMRPWAAIRMSRYLMSVTAVRSSGTFEDYRDTVLAATGVTAAEYMDVEGIDVGFGF